MLERGTRSLVPLVMHGKKEAGPSKAAPEDKLEFLDFEGEGDWHDPNADLGAAGPAGAPGYEGAEKLLDAGFFNAFEDDFDESDMSM